MRDKLQALVDYCDANRSVVESRWIVGRIESILATEHPAVTVRAGWVCKDEAGLWWYSDQPFWVERYQWWDNGGAMHQLLNGAVTDPWPDKANGGPECCMEIK